MKAELAKILEGYGLDAVVVTGMSSHNSSMNYFTGSNMFTKAYVVIPRGGEPTFKFTSAIAVLVLLARREWRAAATMIGTALAVTATYWDWNKVIRKRG